MREESFVLLGYLGLLGFILLMLIFAQPTAVAMMAWGISRAQIAEARRLEAQNEADRLRAAPTNPDLPPHTGAPAMTHSQTQGAARPEAPSDAGWRERVRHVKRGTEYDVLHRGVSLQVALDRLLPNGREWSKALIEGDRLVIYQGKDGKLWAREESEFDDGRFETITPPSDPAPSGQAEG